MGLMDWGKKKVNDVKKDVIKSKAKSAINKKLNLDGKYDEQIDQFADNAIEKVGVDNIIKAKKIADILKD